MAKDIKRHITHLKSKVVENNAPKLISGSDIYEGEIAVNYAKGYETLSIKNESGETVTFLPRPYNSARGGETIHPIFNGTGTEGGTNLSAAWSGNCDDIKTLYDGLTILYKVNTAGHASGDTLSINGGEPHKVVLNASGQLTTHYGVGCIIKLTYDSSVDGTFYTGSTTTKTTTGVWKIENYDSNTDTKVRQTLKTDNAERPLLMSYAANNSTTSNVDNVSYRSNLIYANASAGTITATNFVGKNNGFTIAKDVPSNAVLTDTATTLNGHFTPTATTANTKTATASSTSELSWGSSVVTGVTLSGDAKGHITAVSVASGKLKTPVTGVTLASGTSNGTVKLTVNGSATDNIAVKGLGTAAYKAEGYFAGSGHSHTNMVTGSSLTANNIILGNGNSAIKDSGKSIETTLSSTLDTAIPTSKAVATYVTSQMTSVLTYKGAISANATLQNAHKVGDVYVVSSAGTYAGKACEVGDYLIANTARESASTVTNADWDAINGENQVENKSASLAAAGSSATLATVDGTNITVTTPSTWTGVAKTGTVTKVSTASGLTGGDITSTGTIGLAATGTSGTYYCVKTDAYGRVTSGSSTSPNTDTAVTQTNITTNGSYEVLLASSTATATTTGGSNKNVGMTYNPSTSALTVSKKITTIAANNFITGTGTAGSSGGTPTTYYPAKWTFNKGITVADGDMFTIKIPVAGHTYGTYLSLNNGTNYYPIVTNGTTRLTTQYPVDNYITVVYETGGTATSIYPVTGGTATGTSAAGVFSVVNYKDTTYSTGTAAQLSAGTDTTQRVWAAKNLKTGMDALYQQKGSYATNAFSRIKVNTTNVDADTTGDTFTISGGTFISLTGDATNDKMTIGVSTGTSNSTLARGDHNHDTVYVKKSDVITSITSSNSASTNPVSTSVVAANELVMSEALNDLELRKLDISAYTPTDLSNYYTKSETSGASEISTALGGKVNTATKVSTASGLTGGGNLSVNRTLGLAAVTVAGYTGSSVTSNTVSYDAYGRISSAASIIYSAVTVSSNLTNVTCPSDITGTSKSGSQAIVIYHNGGSTTDYDISISTTNIISPSGEQVNLTCPKSGYCEVNFLNIGGTIFVRGV